MELRQPQRGEGGGTKLLTKLQLSLLRSQLLLSLLLRLPHRLTLLGLKLQVGRILDQKLQELGVLQLLLGCGTQLQHTLLQEEKRVDQKLQDMELQLQEQAPGGIDGMRLPALTGRLQHMLGGLKPPALCSQGIKLYRKLQLLLQVSVALGGMRLLEQHQA